MQPVPDGRLWQVKLEAGKQNTTMNTTDTELLSQDLLRAFEALPEPFLFLTPDLIILAANKAYLDVTQKELFRIKGRYLFDVFPENPAIIGSNATSMLQSSLDQVLEHKKPHTIPLQRYDMPHPEIEGAFKEKFWSIVNSPVIGHNGEISYIIHQVADVTHQVTLRQRENISFQRLLFPGDKDTGVLQGHTDFDGQKLQRLFMQAPAMICVLEGQQHRFKFLNNAFQKLVGNRQLLGKPIVEAVPEIAGQPIAVLLDQVYQTGETIYAHEMKVQLDHENSGTLGNNYYNFIYQATYNAQEQIDGVLLFAYEVTAQVVARQGVEQREAALHLLNKELRKANKKTKASNEALSVAKEQLQQLNQELEKRVNERTQELVETNEQLVRTNIDLDNFIYTASHDLKAPIYNIEGLMKILTEGIPEEMLNKTELSRVLTMIDDSIQRFKNTIEHLTEVTKLQKENSQAAVTINLEEVINDVVLDLASQLNTSGTRLHIDVASCPTIHFSRKNLRSVVYNLLSNAVKYKSPERAPEVWISCFTEGDYHVLEVKDNGLGINLTGRHKLFSMFGRMHNHVEGSGIGLYMVKKIVENADGHIEVESKPGEGAVFRVYFKK